MPESTGQKPWQECGKTYISNYTTWRPFSLSSFQHSSDRQSVRSRRSSGEWASQMSWWYVQTLAHSSTMRTLTTTPLAENNDSPALGLGPATTIICALLGVLTRRSYKGQKRPHRKFGHVLSCHATCGDCGIRTCRFAWSLRGHPHLCHQCYEDNDDEDMSAQQSQPHGHTQQKQPPGHAQQSQPLVHLQHNRDSVRLGSKGKGKASPSTTTDLKCKGSQPNDLPFSFFACSSAAGPSYARAGGVGAFPNPFATSASGSASSARFFPKFPGKGTLS